jgi:hypothetical protein
MHRSIGPDTQNFDTRQATSRSPLLSSLFPINFQAGRINFPVARPRRNEYFLVTLHDSRTFSGGLEYLVTPTRQRPKEPGGPPQASKAPLIRPKRSRHRDTRSLFPHFSELRSIGARGRVRGLYLHLHSRCRGAAIG